MAVSFPLPSGGQQTTTLRTLLTCWNKLNLVLHVLERVHMLVFFVRGAILTAWSGPGTNGQRVL